MKPIILSPGLDAALQRLAGLDAAAAERLEGQIMQAAREGFDCLRCARATIIVSRPDPTTRERAPAWIWGLWACAAGLVPTELPGAFACSSCATPEAAAAAADWDALPLAGVAGEAERQPHHPERARD